MNLLTNCTPHAIVGCLGLADCLYTFMRKRGLASIWDTLSCDDAATQAALVRFIARKFGARKVTMRGFIRRFLPDIEQPVHVQIVLYVQGLRYHTAATRRGGLPELVRPLPIIMCIAAALRQHHYKEHVRRENLE